MLYAITSFEFFDVLAEAYGSAEECTRLLLAIAERACWLNSKPVGPKNIHLSVQIEATLPQRGAGSGY